MNDSEEKRLTLSELRALAEKQDKQDGPWKKEEELPEVSLEELLALGGKKTGNQIVFGPEGKTQLIFRPSKGMVGRAPARWTISLKSKTSAYDTQRELSRANRGLWDKGEGKDKEQGQPAAAFKAARQLLACHAEMEAKQETASSVSEATEGALYAYPKPELETLTEESAKTEDQLNEERNHRMTAQDAINLVIEALSQGRGGKVQMAFDLLQRDQWPQDIKDLQQLAMRLAARLQRPPRKAELRKAINSKRSHSSGTLNEKDFSSLLKHAGLSWLQKHS